MSSCTGVKWGVLCVFLCRCKVGSVLCVFLCKCKVWCMLCVFFCKTGNAVCVPLSGHWFVCQMRGFKPDEVCVSDEGF